MPAAARKIAAHRSGVNDSRSSVSGSHSFMNTQVEARSWATNTPRTSGSMVQ